MSVTLDSTEFRAALDQFRAATHGGMIEVVEEAVGEVSYQAAGYVRAIAETRNTKAKIERLSREYKLRSWLAGRAASTHENVPGYQGVHDPEHRRTHRMYITQGGKFGRQTGKHRKFGTRHTKLQRLRKYNAEFRTAVCNLIVGRRKAAVHFLEMLCWNVYRMFAPGVSRGRRMGRGWRCEVEHAHASTSGDIVADFDARYSQVRRHPIAAAWPRAQVLLDAALAFGVVVTARRLAGKAEEVVARAAERASAR